MPELSEFATELLIEIIEVGREVQGAVLLFVSYCEHSDAILAEILTSF